MRKNELISTREKKSLDVKGKILKTTSKLMNRYGYEYLTVRNICKSADVSIGTFYHHFKNKDSVMSYFLTKGYEKYKKENTLIWEGLSAQYRLIHLFTWLGIYFVELGFEFVSSYYSCKNQALNVRNLDASAVHIDLINDLLSELETAQKEGMISPDININNVYYELNRIFFGNVFDWCLCNASFDLALSMKRMLTIHLNYYLADPYKMNIESTL